MKNRYREMYKLRLEGKTYKEIGKKFNITHQGVAYILLKYFPKIIIPTKKTYKKVCLVCNNIFYTYNKESIPIKYCSNKCWLKIHTNNGKKSTPEYKRERMRKYKKKYYKTKKGKKIIKKIMKKQQKKFKEKTNARQLLNSHIKLGKIKKPQKCSNCGQSKLRITGHHEDYSKPLEVVWLCDYCHQQLHKKIKVIQ